MVRIRTIGHAWRTFHLEVQAARQAWDPGAQSSRPDEFVSDSDPARLKLGPTPAYLLQLIGLKVRRSAKPGTPAHGIARRICDDPR